MKQTSLFEHWSENLTLWLQQFDIANVVVKMADLNDSNAVIMLDKKQTVLFWSRGAEIITGLKREDVIGRPCIKECSIIAMEQISKEPIKIPATGGNLIEVEKYTQVLYNREGYFAGGIVLLTPGKEVAANMSVTNNPRIGKEINFQGILSRSPTMYPVFQLIQNAAKTEATVLVRGESGSGKELVAHAIHDLGSRRDAPFLAINCAALSTSLLESELFGHVRGAFTGAIKDHTGLFQRAAGGTLFLDEVAEMPLELQAKLLRVIQERNYIPVGGTQMIAVDVRIVAATHRSLRIEVKEGRFREDLMYRLRVVPIFIPPLRDRREDINLLLWHFIKQHNLKGMRRIERIHPQAMRILLDYPWPGNIRELQNVVEYFFAVGSGTVLRLSELPPEFRESTRIVRASPQGIALSADEEADSIRRALEQNNGKVTRAATMLGMSRVTFWRKRKLYGI